MSTGGPEKLVWEEVPLPAPKPGEALVRHKAVGLNYIDVYFRTGLYKAPSMPATIGMEGAGVVEAVGEGVTDVAAGDRVAYAGALGAYAEARCAPADRLVKIPEGIGFEQAAAMMLQGMTAQFLVTPHLCGEAGRDHPGACRGRRRRPDPGAMGEAPRRHRHRRRLDARRRPR